MRQDDLGARDGQRDHRDGIDGERSSLVSHCCSVKCKSSDSIDEMEVESHCYSAVRVS